MCGLSRGGGLTQRGSWFSTLTELLSLLLKLELECPAQAAENRRRGRSRNRLEPLSALTGTPQGWTESQKLMPGFVASVTADGAVLQEPESFPAS